VVEGNPLEEISVLQEEKNLKIIMKNGRMAKNSLQEETR
jgi:imidazolonepropionase-like amidohydrolase